MVATTTSAGEADEAQILDLPTPDDTARLGRALAAACIAQATAIEAHGLQVNLDGDLGAGKTAVVRALLRTLGVTGTIRSPTFSIVEPYVVSLHQSAPGLPPELPQSTDGRLEAEGSSSLDFYHLDFYRFADPEEFSSGFRELFGRSAICAVEWPDRAGSRLPAADLTIALQVAGDGRRATLRAAGELGHACLQSTMKEWTQSHDAAG